MRRQVRVQSIFPDTKGEIEKNKNLMENIIPGELTSKIIQFAHHGSPFITLGAGSPQVMITAGLHGNELPPQVALLKLLENLKTEDLRGKIFAMPFCIPWATMKNDRRYKGFDPNRTANKLGSVSNRIMDLAKSLKVVAVADFHSTKPGSNPGVESVFCSKKPSPKSFQIAQFIVKTTSCKMICHENAGNLYRGALEDEFNLQGIPAVTCEVVSRNYQVDEGSVERSYLQMMSFLEYFDIVQYSKN